MTWRLRSLLLIIQFCSQRSILRDLFELTIWIMKPWIHPSQDRLQKYVSFHLGDYLNRLSDEFSNLEHIGIILDILNITFQMLEDCSRTLPEKDEN